MLSENRGEMRSLSRNILLVDLDGTLTDPAEGIVGSFRHALERLGLFAPPAAELGWIIGPPLGHSFHLVSGGKADPEAALEMYRARYGAEGLFQATVYRGVPEALSELNASGARLILCTAKPAVYAERIIRHFALDRHFEAGYGAEAELSAAGAAALCHSPGEIFAAFISLAASEPAGVAS